MVLNNLISKKKKDFYHCLGLKIAKKIALKNLISGKSFHFCLSTKHCRFRSLSKFGLSEIKFGNHDNRNSGYYGFYDKINLQEKPDIAKFSGSPRLHPVLV